MSWDRNSQDCRSHSDTTPCKMRIALTMLQQLLVLAGIKLFTGLQCRPEGAEAI